MFKSMGHENVFVLDGGLPEWELNDYPTANKLSQIKEHGNFKSKFFSNSIKSFQVILDSIECNTYLIIDARSSGRFTGVEPEPREGLRGGHIPSSINLPYTSLLNGHKYIAKEKIKELYSLLNVNIDQPIIFSCGSGVTACVDLLAAYQVGFKNLSVYDGSWTEWGADDNLPLSK